MEKKIRPSWAEVDLDALRNNVSEVKRVSEGKEIIATIKADGYGHGAIDICKSMMDEGINRFAVAIVTEAVELRKAGVEIPIIILGYTPKEFYDEVIDLNLEQTIYDYEDAKILSDIAIKKNSIAKIHIAVDTGMGRIGFLTTREQAREVHRITKLKGVRIVGIFTHFATADEKDKTYASFQIEKFNIFNIYLEELGVIIPFKHVSNSAAIIDFPDLPYDGVRAGIMLYGYYPSKYVNKNNVNLIPVMSLKCKIVHLKKIQEGDYVSYGRLYKAPAERIIGTLPIGYADGISRALTGVAKVIVNGKIVPVVGRICMDQYMIDVTDVPGVKIGDEVILIGKDNIGNVITADDIAESIGTVNYEVICDISKRIPRIYTKNGKIFSVRNYV
ncbi:alanine racemase [uncultured Clostridium sp.]|uniref:alanine racemase n=1 Tax=uncultured Clostridium sp. TaxID=59620 RepID=UPI003216B8C3